MTAFFLVSAQLWAVVISSKVDFFPCWQALMPTPQIIHWTDFLTPFNNMSSFLSSAPLLRPLNHAYERRYHLSNSENRNWKSALGLYSRPQSDRSRATSFISQRLNRWHHYDAAQYCDGHLSRYVSINDGQYSQSMSQDSFQIKAAFQLELVPIINFPRWTVRRKPYKLLDVHLKWDFLLYAQA